MTERVLSFLLPKENENIKQGFLPLAYPPHRNYQITSLALSFYTEARDVCFVMFR